MSSATGLVIAFLTGAFGVGGALVVVLAAHPEKVQLWGALIWGALARITKRAELRYVGSDVAAQINAHMARDVLPTLTGLTATRVSVRWSNSADEVAREAGGTLVVRLRHHEDRLVNVLGAYLVAAPRLYAPAVRSQLEASQSRAIDLQLCRKLAQNISQSALTVYRVNILDPHLTDDPHLAVLLDDLNAVDLGGLFVPILLQELIKLGGLYPADSLPQLDAEVQRFTQFLKTVAQRSSGEIVELSFLGQYIRINTLLVARSVTRSQGVAPFRARVGIELAKGVETFYVMATDANIEFAARVANALDSDRRLLRRDERRLFIVRDGARRKGSIIPFERNTGYAVDELLEEGVRTGEFATGAEHDATVTDVQPSYVAVDINGVQGVIPISELSWSFVQDCQTEIQVGDEFKVTILNADPDQQELVVSRRRSLRNPLSDINPASLRGTRRTLVVTARGGNDIGRRFVAGYLKELPAVPGRLPEGELEWGAPLRGVQHIPDGDEVQVLVHDVRLSRGYVVCSEKRLCANRWDEIRAKYPRGSRLTVRTATIRPEGIWCQIEPGLTGFVPAVEFRQAGLEYADFQRNIHVGQDLFVYVTRVVAGTKQRINLGLQRNLRSGNLSNREDT